MSKYRMLMPIVSGLCGVIARYTGCGLHECMCLTTRCIHNLAQPVRCKLYILEYSRAEYVFS